MWLKLQPYRQQSVQQRSNQKISPKYYGPYQIQATIGKAAYKLKLPATARIHDVFQSSQLKAFHGNLAIATHIPHWFHGQDVGTVLRPQVLLDRRVVKVHSQAQVQYVVQWEGASESDASWEVADFETNFLILIVQFIDLRSNPFKGEGMLRAKVS